jgi:metallo-beta-lactamase family protein
MHLVEASGQRILLDCGLSRDRHTPGHALVEHFPVPASTLDAVVISHSHIDHCGNLPRLVREGFSGPVYCTAATCDLLALMLGNSARIQEEDAFITGVIGPPEDAAARPLFTRPDAERAVLQCVAVPYGEARDIATDVSLRFFDAGHILGSAMVQLTFRGRGGGARLTFTGDVGRQGALLIPGPTTMPEADLLVSESTYGGRRLDRPDAAAHGLEDVVRRTVEREGKVLIPSFSLGRTQVALYVLGRGMAAGRVPRVPVYVDSALAADIAEAYGRHAALLTPAAAEFLTGDVARYVRSHDESQGLTALREPCVIIAPGGMCEGGRILHHLRRHVDDPRSSVVLVNYQAPHTPGRRLLERGPTVRFHGRKWNKWAEVVYLAGFSGHADHDDLLALVGPLAGRIPRLRLVHGEPDQAEALAADLRDRGFSDVAIPHRGETVSVA